MRDYCDITILLDRSGSMSTIKEGTINGVNEFIKEQKQIPGDGCWTLVLFDDHGSASGAKEEFPHYVYTQVPQENVTELSDSKYKPRGGTALIDAACNVIDSLGKRLNTTPEHLRPNKVLVVIVTDGKENSSKTYRKSDLAERIAHQESVYNWKFIYLGANQDAIAEAAGYGISTRGVNYEYTSAGITAAFHGTSSSTRQWKLDGNDTAKDYIIEPVREIDVTVKVS